MAKRRINTRLSPTTTSLRFRPPLSLHPPINPLDNSKSTMVHVYSQSFLYSHPWSHVNLGIWHKYPNPKCAHVTSVDVVDRSVDPVTGVIRTERILGCKQAAPRWIVKLLGGSDDAFVREISFVDPVTARTTVTSVNLSLSQYVTVLENIVYEPARGPNGQMQTRFTQTAEIQSRMAIWRSVGEQLEKFSVDRFGQNAELGREGFEGVLRMLLEQKQAQRS